MSSRKMFGQHFHALICHAPLLYRIISLCSLNTESEERMFGQCKAITRSTPNHRANHIITNILVKIYEEKCNEAICAITRSTSNHRANHIITNILVRIHEEEKCNEAKCDQKTGE